MNGWTVQQSKHRERTSASLTVAREDGDGACKYRQDGGWSVPEHRGDE